MAAPKTVENYLERNKDWNAELNLLRTYLKTTTLLETIKWGAPTYTFSNKNIVGMSAFKSYVGLWFFQGVFLKDEQQKLLNAQKGITKALRQWRFSSMEEIKENKNLIISYIKEAVENQKAGKELKPVRNKNLKVDPLLKTTLDNNNDLKNCFEKLPLGKRREFSEYIGNAKRIETQQKRLEKITPLIKSGIGLNDKYRKC